MDDHNAEEFESLLRLSDSRLPFDCPRCKGHGKWVDQNEYLTHWICESAECRLEGWYSVDEEAVYCGIAWRARWKAVCHGQNRWEI